MVLIIIIIAILFVIGIIIWVTNNDQIDTPPNDIDSEINEAKKNKEKMLYERKTRTSQAHEQLSKFGNLFFGLNYHIEESDDGAVICKGSLCGSKNKIHVNIQLFLGAQSTLVWHLTVAGYNPNQDSNWIVCVDSTTDLSDDGVNAMITRHAKDIEMLRPE